MKTVKNLLYNASYQVFLLLIPLLTQPYVSRVLLPHGNGIYNSTFNTMQYFVMLGDLGISLYANREIAYHRENKEERSKIFWEIELLQIATTGTAFVFFLVYFFINPHYFSIQLLQILWPVSAGIDISWYFMAMEEFGKTVIRNTLVKVVSISLIFMFVKTPKDLVVYTIIQGGAQLLGALTLWPYLRQSVEKINLHKLKPWRHLRPSFLLFIPNIAVQVYSVVNKSMLQYLDGVSAVAFFTFGDNIVRTILAVVTASGAVMLPRISNRFARGDIKGVHESLYRNMNFVSAIAFPLMFGVAAIGDKFAPLFFGQHYQPSGSVIVAESPIILLIAWTTVIGRQYLMPVRRMREYTTSVTIGAAINIITNLPLILWFGTTGTAIATVISEIAVTLYQIYCVQDSISIQRMFHGQWKYLLCGFTMYIVVHTLSIRWTMTIVHVSIEVMIGVFIYISGVLLVRGQIVDEARTVLLSRLHKGN